MTDLLHQVPHFLVTATLRVLKLFQQIDSCYFKHVATTTITYPQTHVKTFFLVSFVLTLQYVASTNKKSQDNSRGVYMT